MRTCLALLAAAALALPACRAEEVSGPVAACAPVPAGLEPSSGPAAGGTEVVVSGVFLTGGSLRDAEVRVGGADAEVTRLERQGCATCDACADEALACASCDRECRGLAEYVAADGTVHGASLCTETLAFVTPPGAPGPAAIVLVTGRGSDASLVFDYAGDDDDSAGDDDDSAGDDDDSARGDGAAR